jgi:hypothetical protein
MKTLSLNMKQKHKVSSTKLEGTVTTNRPENVLPNAVKFKQEDAWRECLHLVISRSPKWLDQYPPK